MAMTPNSAPPTELDPPREKNVRCSVCDHRNRVAADAVDVRCDQCDSPGRNSPCESCGVGTWIWGEPKAGSRWTCPRCGGRNLVDRATQAPEQPTTAMPALVGADTP